MESHPLAGEVGPYGRLMLLDLLPNTEDTTRLVGAAPGGSVVRLGRVLKDTFKQIYKKHPLICFSAAWLSPSGE